MKYLIWFLGTLSIWSRQEQENGKIETVETESELDIGQIDRASIRL
jgi:hypothetical protein